MGPIAASFLAELNHEAATTRKFLELVPDDKLGWQPHEKSMTLGKLAAHLAEIPGWAKETLTMTVLDFATGDYKPPVEMKRADLLAMFDKNVALANEIIGRTSDEDFMVNWTMRAGEQVFFTMPRVVVVRTWIFNHTVHHRAQLGVYYRLLGLAVPSAYGPTADSPTF